MNREPLKTDGRHTKPDQQAGHTAHPLDRYSVQPPAQGNSGDDSPFYKSQAPSITLPKGGGALKGIDEKFTVNAVNGTAALEIPLPLTPGRNGFTPSLSLQYNSGGGNSAFGLGWSLSLPSIQRRTDKQLPQYRDSEESDVFLLAGAEDLVPEQEEVNGKWVVKRTEVTLDGITCQVTRYRPRIEGLFARIEYIRKPGEAGGWWRVTTKENITTYYGLTAQARITDPRYAHRIFKWLPELVCDDKGNVQQYTYAAEDAANVPAKIYERNRVQDGQLQAVNAYLKSVRYANLTPYQPVVEHVSTAYEPAAPSGDFLLELVLDYGEHDPDYPEPSPAPGVQWPCRYDPFSDYRPGFEIRTYRRCKRALMFHRFTELNDGEPTLVRSLDLTWAHEGLAPGSLVEADYITEITQAGYKLVSAGNLSDPDEMMYFRKALPAMSFGYEPLAWDTSLKNVSPEDAANAPQGLTGPYQWTDFYGEGISGILTEQGTGWYYKRNLGDAHFTPAQQIAPKPSFTGLGGGGLQWQDLDADGRRQVVASAGAVKGYWELDDDDQWQRFRAFEKNINIDWSSPYTLTLDLDGDGRADALLTEDRVWTWYRNKGTKGYDEGGQASVFRDEEQGPVLVLNDAIQRIFLADMSGDGLSDLVRIRNGEVCYWPNKGYGRFGSKVTMSGSPRFDRPDQYDPKFLTLADISGTGASDLIYIGKGKCTAWINRCGNGWSEGVDISYLPSADAYSRIAVLDFLGNGTGCIVWSSPLPQHASAPLRYIDLMGGKKPYLMKTYGNGMGKTVALTYKSSTQCYLEDRREGLHWATKLPFPVHCLERVETADAVSQTSYTQSYRYHHGYYDHPEREFRGFGRVDTLDIETADTGPGELDQAPVLTKTWYHTGAWTREKKLEERYQEEYFPVTDWDDETTIITLPAGLSPQELREAHRALKTLPLRQEVYAQDGSGEEKFPYTVTAFAYQVVLKQPLHTNRYASFYPYQEQSIAFHAERIVEEVPEHSGNWEISDPRVVHELTLEIDDYGNIRKSAQVVYPRKHIPGALPDKVSEAQDKMHVLCTETGYTNDAIDEAGYTYYRLCRPYEERRYEVNLSEPAGLWTPGLLLLRVITAVPVDYWWPPQAGEKRLLEHSLICYRADDGVTALGFGELDSRAIEDERYRLAFTSTLLQQLYYNRDEFGNLTDVGRVTDALLAGAGYTDALSDGRWWLPSGTADYQVVTDPELSFFTPDLYTDPWDNETKISYWGSYYLLPQQVEDAKGNVTEVTGYDWRILQPVSVKDPNDNVSLMLYDALGLPAAMALSGKPDPHPAEGDSLEDIDPESSGDLTTQSAFWTDPEGSGAPAVTLLHKATWRCVYDFSAQPAAVGMIARERHNADDPASPVLIRLTYTDGLGRVLMQKAQCAATTESGNKGWIGSGRTIYNNKGKAVMQYEPYFSATHGCDTAEQAALDGVSEKLHYDPLGRVQRTDYPDGTFETTVWTPWEQTLYDRNDNVAGSAWYAAWSTGTWEQQDAAAKALAHNNTPTVQYLDTLARPFYTRQYLEDAGTATDPGAGFIDNYARLDVDGNRLEVGTYYWEEETPGNWVRHYKQALTYYYNMLRSVCWQQSADSGLGRMLVDVSGQPFCGWDADDRQFRYSYDALRRPVAKDLWLYEEVDPGPPSVREWQLVQGLERMAYGEGETDDKDHNLRGQLYQSKDGAGVVTIPDYDFKGNPLSSVRRYTVDATTHPDWTGSVALEADGSSNPLEYTTATMYDALNRPVTLTTPDGGETLYTYNKTGLLYTVDIDDVHTLSDEIVRGLVYDAKGQRLKIQYGNDTTTTYAYDPYTFRVTQIRTTRPGSPDVLLQDLRYWYDPVGNVTLQKDKSWDYDTGEQLPYFGSHAVVKPHNNYTYDALCRLIEVRGREHEGSNTAPDHQDSGRTGFYPIPVASTDTEKMRRYTQYYEYDAVGNMLQLRHTVTGGAGNWTRYFTMESDSNRLHQSVIGAGTPETYTYDNRGNLTGGMSHLSGMVYNAENRLEVVTDIDTDIVTYCQYDSNGQRVRKTTVNSDANITGVRKYVGGWEVYQKKDGLGAVVLERETLHISDDSGRIALVDTPTVQPSPVTEYQLLRYQYSNHLGSAMLELDDAGGVISYEEYYPYGSTSFQAGRSVAEVSLKRYRWTGKIRDEETGLYYHGARYYIPWLARWASSDPLQSEMPEWSSYNYGYCNPIIWTDPTGMQPGSGDDPNWHAPMSAPEGGFSNGVGSSWNPIQLPEVTVTAQAKQPAGEASGVFSWGGNLEGGRWLDVRGAQYRFEYSEAGFGDWMNYVKFVDNAALSVWNAAVGAIDVLVNNVNLADEAGAYIKGTYDYITTTPASQQLADLKSDAIGLATNIQTYENLGGALLFKVGLHSSSKAPSVPVSRVAGGVSETTTLSTGSFYSVAFEVKLPSNLYPGKGYYSHFKAANVSLSEAMASDASFGSSISKLGIDIPRSSTGSILGKSPTGWVWHHNMEAGVMQLVPKIQHSTGSMFWNTMHPGGVGGMSIWGR